MNSLLPVIIHCLTMLMLSCSSLLLWFFGTCKMNCMSKQIFGFTLVNNPSIHYPSNLQTK